MKNLKDKLIKESTRIIFVKEGSKVFLAPYPMKAFGKKNKIEIWDQYKADFPDEEPKKPMGKK